MDFIMLLVLDLVKELVIRLVVVTVVLVVMVEMVRPSVARLTTQVKVEESRGKKLLEG